MWLPEARVMGEGELQVGWEWWGRETGAQAADFHIHERVIFAALIVAVPLI